MNDNPDTSATEGLIKKYDVTRVDGDPTGKHATCEVFVLDPQHDKKARTALLTYAQEAARDGHDQLAVDIIYWVGRLEMADHHPKLLESYDREAEQSAQEQSGLDVEIGGDECGELLPGDEVLPLAKRKVCPIHQQTDCSPLLNGCSELTKNSEPAQQDFHMDLGHSTSIDGVTHHEGVGGTVIREPGDGSPLDNLLDHFGVQGTFVVPPIENKGGYSSYVDPTDGKRI